MEIHFISALGMYTATAELLTLLNGFMGIHRISALGMYTATAQLSFPQVVVLHHCAHRNI